MHFLNQWQGENDRIRNSIYYMKKLYMNGTIFTLSIWTDSPEPANVNPDHTPQNISNQDLHFWPLIKQSLATSADSNNGLKV